MLPWGPCRGSLHIGISFQRRFDQSARASYPCNDVCLPQRRTSKRPPRRPIPKPVARSLSRLIKLMHTKRTTLALLCVQVYHFYAWDLRKRPQTFIGSRRRSLFFYLSSFWNLISRRLIKVEDANLHLAFGVFYVACTWHC